MGVSLVLIPMMARVAPHLGLVDMPSARKVHEVPIPRVGGIGIVVGAVLTILVGATLDKVVISYLLGTFILLAFGALDDRSPLTPKFKFLGQLLAVVPMLFIAELYVTRFPLLNGYELPVILGILFTVFSVSGVINAINTSDGLDGLAGGEVMISLFGIALLAFAANGESLLFIAMATMGGLVGFLRYNTQPARIFMGDAGSQYLGFSVAFLIVYLTQHVDRELSPGVVLLILGLPIADLIIVVMRRVKRGVSPVSPDKDHLHHRLMKIGFTHQRSVVVIYSIQALLVITGILLKYQPDWLLLSIYGIFCLLVFGGVQLAEKGYWTISEAHTPMRLIAGVEQLNSENVDVLIWGPRRFLQYGVPAYLLVGILFTNQEVPAAFAAIGASALSLLLVHHRLSGAISVAVKRIAIYSIVTTVAFYLSYYADINDLIPRRVEQAYLILVAVAVITSVRLSPGRRSEEFKTTPLDYLIVMVLVIVWVASDYLAMDRENAGLLLRILVMLYACELMLVERREGNDTLKIGSIVAAFGIIQEAI